MTREYKTCSTCGRKQSVTSFHKSNRRAGCRTRTAGYRQSRCARCQAADRERYRARNRRFLAAEKERVGCADCGFPGPACALDFHHVKGKVFTLSGRRANQLSIADLQAEIKKCIVVCANCHRIRHWIGEKRAVAH